MKTKSLTDLQVLKRHCKKYAMCSKCIAYKEGLFSCEFSEPPADWDMRKAKALIRKMRKEIEG